MEGLFNYKAGTKEEYLDEIRKGKEKLRICSFSKDPTNLLLWAHYADRFKGICIEVEINDNTSEFDIAEVEYTSARALFSNKAVRLKGELPRLIFSQKAEDWSAEKEVRLLSEKKYLCLRDGVKITGILLGLRTSGILKETLITLAKPDVKIWETKIGDANQIVIGKQANRTANEFEH
jgi:hypothetical protein